MEKRYGVLRVVATLWKIIAWIVLVLGILGAIGTLIFGIAGASPQFWRMMGMGPAMREGGIVIGIVGFLVGLLVSVIYFLVFFAMGQLITLMIDIEENTRALRIATAGDLPPEGYST